MYRLYHYAGIPGALPPQEPKTMTIPLNLSAGQQDALAQLCILLSSVSYAHDQNKPANQEHIDQLDTIADRFDRINWGELYDKLHRTGANA